MIDGGGERMLQKYFTPSRLMTFFAQRGEPNDGESVRLLCSVLLQKKYVKSEPKPFCPYTCSRRSLLSKFAGRRRENLARSLLLSYYVAPECRQSAGGAAHKLFIELGIQIW